MGWSRVGRAPREFPAENRSVDGRQDLDGAAIRLGLRAWGMADRRAGSRMQLRWIGEADRAPIEALRPHARQGQAAGLASGLGFPIESRAFLEKGKVYARAHEMGMRLGSPIPWVQWLPHALFGFSR